MGYWHSNQDEMKAKVGQLLYNLYLAERLKAEVVEKLYSKNRISLQIDLGKDKDGNDVVMDILLSRIPPKVREIKEDEGVPEPPQQEPQGVINPEEEPYKTT